MKIDTRSGFSSRFIFLSLILIVFCALCAACGGDDEGGSSSIPGGGSSDSGGDSSLPWASASVTELSFNTWVNGNITAAGGTQWFRFTATAATQHIHFKPSTLSDVLLQVYAGTGAVVGDEENLFDDEEYGSQLVMARTLEIGQTYYMRVWAYDDSDVGAYQMTINGSPMLPGETWPPANSITTELTEGEWLGGHLNAGGVWWFKFTATAATHYIHLYEDSSVYDIYVQMFTGSGALEGEIENLFIYYVPEDEPSARWTSLVSGGTYYLRVWAYYTDDAGTVMLSYNKSATAPSLSPGKARMPQSSLKRPGKK
ncbi:MAG: hypothetical protein LBC99_02960 [Spirochaetota bacterium]|nr:hypothetical protein [Spirochaetota bacterium]